MIAKKVVLRAGKRSSFATLANYITDAQSKTERVGAIRLTNLESEEFDWAVKEAVNTQGRNTRVADDKTYHLLISFALGEDPTPEVLVAAEDRLCNALGFAEHQRISAVHRDTDNVHIHVAINKIHPERFTIHTPYRDYWVLGKECAQIEKDFGLVVTQHAGKKIGSENRVDDMERHSGIQSQVSWMRENCLETLKAASTWQELHEAAAEFGLVLQKRSGGLVFVSDEGVGVKASSVDRSLSLAKLERQLGTFSIDALLPQSESINQAGDESDERGYRAAPLKSSFDTSELYSRYVAEQAAIVGGGPINLTGARLRRVEAIASAKQYGRGRRALIRAVGGSAAEKAVSFGLARQNVKKRVDAARLAFSNERNGIAAGRQRLAWASWLKAEAAKGNSAAVAALRARDKRDRARGGTVSAGAGSLSAENGAAFRNVPLDGVTGHGTAIYRVQGGTLRDDGEKLHIDRQATPLAMANALRLAARRHGRQLHVEGPAEFREQLARVAAASGANITFSDAGLEARRIALTAILAQRKENHERHRGHADDRQRGSIGGGDGLAGRGTARVAGTTGVGSAGGIHAGTVAQPGSGRAGVSTSADAGNVRGRDNQASPGAGRGGGDTRANAGTVRTRGNGKPNVAAVGREPPAFRKNRLRGLRELGVVRIGEGSEVLLPGHVPAGVVEQGAERPDRVRREIHRPGRGIAGIAAAEKYMAERNEKRRTIFDIPKHDIYNSVVETTAVFEGVRVVDDQNLALFKRGDGIEIQPIDQATAQRLSRIRRGAEVVISEQGTVKTRGRSR